MSLTKNTIEVNTLVELKYEVVDKKSDETLIKIEYPISYVHGTNTILSPEVMAALLGRSAGEIIDVPLDCNRLYGPRDESLVYTDVLENVPEEYREIGTTITMQNSKGENKNFIVTRMDDKTLTVDGNNPLSGREVLFKLEVLSVRDATDEEIALGGKVGADPDITELLEK